MSRLKSALVLVAFLAIAYGVAAFGTIATITHVDGWYADAEKASWSPPNLLFGPVWTVLYALMAVAAWLVWRERGTTDVRRPLTIYVIQLALNAIWTPLFFALYPVVGVAALWAALAVIVALDVFVLLTMLAFWRVKRVAAVLLIPYWAWVLFATTLNVAIAVLQS
ncbi:MAG: TspO/MBR family protein [Pseudolysinimonas sp.]|uniref:TspO/MBR family protein n=1 Tax=Pseudolysinimonas sp. TaxID=2680009 RepID=UPI003262ECEC